MASKVERIQTLIMRNISEIIQFQIKNPKLGFVTIPEVKVSKDFSHAKVYVSFIKEEEIRKDNKLSDKDKLLRRLIFSCIFRTLYKFYVNLIKF